MRAVLAGMAILRADADLLHLAVDGMDQRERRGERDFDRFRVDPTQTLYLSGTLLDAPVPDYVRGVVAPPGAMGENARGLVIEGAAG